MQPTDNDQLTQVFTDVAPSRAAPQQKDEAASTLRTIFNAAQTGMFTFAPVYNREYQIVDFRFGMVNQTLAAHAGKRPEDLEGQPGTSWFPGYLTNGEFDLYCRCFETGEPQQKEIHYVADGRDVYLELKAAKIGDQLLVTLTDFSRVRSTQRQLEKLVEDLKLSNERLEEFAHAASHDLKEPIRKINVFCNRLNEMLADRLDTTERHLFERMYNASGRMMLLVDDLLNYSQLGMKPMEMESVDLNIKISVVLADLEVQVEEKGAEIVVENLPTVLGYRRQLQQLFQNLVSNSLKYTKPDEKPVVRIRARQVSGADFFDRVSALDREKQFQLIEVVDNGIGFGTEDAERIFQLFHRLHGRSEYIGTGIGLSIARKVVQNHNGYIWAEGESGKGAAFKVLLPMWKV